MRGIEREVGKGWGLHCSLYGTAHHLFVTSFSLSISFSLVGNVTENGIKGDSTMEKVGM